MQTIIDFLRQLAANNNREWFTAHKDECKAAQAQFGAWVEGLAQRMAADDPTLAGLTARDMTYRIYRDTRFSHDKTPYKTHMGAFICRGGKKSGTLLRENALKRNPKGFDKDAPWSEYIRLRNFCLAYTPTTAEVTAPDFADRLLESFTAVRPFIDYINRAIDFAREEL